VSGLHYALATLGLGKQHQLPTVWKARWAQEPSHFSFCFLVKSFTTALNQTSFPQFSGA